MVGAPDTNTWLSPGSDASVSSASASVSIAQDPSEGGRRFTTELTGEAEVSNAGVPNRGDLDGTGTASIAINPGQERVCFDIEVANIVAPARGHIHRAPAGANGPIVVGFFEVDSVLLNNCVDTTRALAKEIIQNPERFYDNVHNAEFPGGALRGQLSK